uniref:Uncharacterized protein n=1 Tax=Odontella aurita TaxID=265563 RepID=A0A7S4JIS8_9STRA|mmetsp:Transcript_47063/g.142524  ORF Transcript_47063/g.142524 Transcript_47063/m.142524 type:complete len:242 (+) Transcript_47063:251-976(+)
MIDTATFTCSFGADSKKSKSSVQTEDVLISEDLQRCLSKADWGALIDLLDSLGDSADSKLSSDSAMNFGLCTGSNIVHAICAYDAPIEIVRTILEVCPGMTSERDCFDQTPLHVAVKRASVGTSPACIRALLSQYPAAACMQDRNGMTPLMLACGNMRRVEFSGWSRQRSSYTDSLVATIRVLALSAPRAIVIEDENGRTAVEHALFSGVPESGFLLLQRVSRDVRSKAWQNKAGNEARLE